MFSQKILKFFPPPAFLTIPCAGLSMSDNHVRAIEFESKDGKGLRLKKYAELDLPAGAITDGRVNNKDQIIPVLEQLKKQTGIQYVRVSLPEEKAYVFEIEIPVVDPKEVRSAIEFKIEENVPWKLDQVVFDYAITSEDKVKNSLHIVVMVLPVKFVNIYMDMLTTSGLIAYSLEIESQAFARSLIARGDKNTYLLIRFGADKAGLCIVSDEIVHFTSTLTPIDGWQENPASMISEIKKVVTYWNNDRKERSDDRAERVVQKIIVCGHDFNEASITQLSSLLDIEIVLGNVWLNAFNINKTLPEISFIESLRYAAATGLALPPDSLI